MPVFKGELGSTVKSGRDCDFRIGYIRRADEISGFGLRHVWVGTRARANPTELLEFEMLIRDKEEGMDFVSVSANEGSAVSPRETQADHRLTFSHACFRPVVLWRDQRSLERRSRWSSPSSSCTAGPALFWSISYISHAAPAAVFLQYGTDEPFLNADIAKQYLEVVSEPKTHKIYDAPHALNAEATRDRIAFLVDQLSFKLPDDNH